MGMIIESLNHEGFCLKPMYVFTYIVGLYIYIGIYIVVQNCFGGSISILYFSPIQIDVSFFGAFHNPNWLFWGFGGIFL